MSARRPRQNPAPPSGQLRIIAGKWRSRRLAFPSAEGLRPTGDRIRETLFNWLAPHIVGARCLDAFAGSGALGFEALSRGAREVVMVEKSAAAHASLVRNRDTLGADNCHIVLADALTWLGTPSEQAFDIIFLDPPFAHNLHSRCLEAIAGSGLHHPGTLIYVESPADYAPALPANWALAREKFAGSLAYRLLQTA